MMAFMLYFGKNAGMICYCHFANPSYISLLLTLFPAQIKFAPLDHRRYEERVVLMVENAPDNVHIICHGNGLEPQLEFDQTMLQFDPCLPYGPGDERTIVVSNPCNYPIEFYSLEMDSVAFEVKITCTV